MKKLIPIIALACILIILLCIAVNLASCNYQMIDLTYQFDYAYISYGDGTVTKVKIASWRDFEDGDQIQVTGTDGTTYLVHSENCVLVKEGA